MSNFATCLFALPLGALALPLAPHAQTAAEAPGASATGDPSVNAAAPSDIVVTALRTPVPLDQVSSSITVLDQQAIQAAQPIALTDVLQRTPGITVNTAGGYGETTGLSIRGAGTDETVVVIDGMRVADPTTPAGNFDFSQLFADDIARVEILRGPQSILWGSDAIGGVVSVTTVTPTEPLEEDFSVEVGSRDTVNAHAGIGGTSKLVDWRISGSAFTTEGIPTLAGGTQDNGYDRKAASGTATVHIVQNISLDLRGYWDGGRNSYSDDYNSPTGGIYAGDYATTKQWTVYAGLNANFLDGRWTNRLAAMQDKTDNEDYTPIDTLYGDPALQFVGHGRIRRYEYESSLTLLPQVQIVFGAERKEERMETAPNYFPTFSYDLTPHAANTNSVYTQARVEPAKGLTLNGGVRYDHHSIYGGHTVFSVGGDYTPDAGKTLLRASYDQGFKAPSLYQLYSDYGNIALRPETAKGWEVGAERHFGSVFGASATWFERKTNNLITFVDCPVTDAPPVCQFNFGEGYYLNVDKARAHGLELAANLRLGHFFANGNYSFISSEDRTPGSATFGQQLPRVPRHLANATVGYDWPHDITTSVALRTASSSTDTDFNLYPSVPVTLGAYALVDVRLDWKVTKSFTVYGRVENIGDKRYETVYDYNSLGRSAYVGIRMHF